MLDKSNLLLKLDDLIVFYRVRRVAFVELIHEVSQLFLFALHVELVAFEVVIFMLGEHATKLHVQAVEQLIDLSLVFSDLSPSLALEVRSLRLYLLRVYAAAAVERTHGRSIQCLAQESFAVLRACGRLDCRFCHL